jgi:MFS family permease/quinol monooxygenase YgiN
VNAADAQAAANPGPLAPLKLRAFRWLWLAALGSNVGTWMHDVGAGWLMTGLSPSPLMVSLVQAATTLPILLLALPAGALADVVDRRKLLIVCQGGAALLALLLAILGFAGAITAWVLLAITLGLGVFAALSNPAWQTIMTDLVPREQLPQASSLNSVSLNLSRAIGPALGGLAVAHLGGPAAAFALNAVSFVGIILVLAAWRYRPPERAVPGERFLGALKAGVRYVRHSPPIRAVLVRTASFVVFSSALWALMPLIARQELGLSASGYGVLVTCLGVGAVTAALFLNAPRRRLGPNRTLALATLLYAAASATLALTSNPLVGYGAMVVAGIGWLSVVVSLNVSAQSGTPPWVRARALACYLATFFGGMALGSAVWGWLATVLDAGVLGLSGVDGALACASAGLLLGLATMFRWRLVQVSGEDVAQSAHWEMPVVSQGINPDDGPVVITIEYRIRPEDADRFVAAMGPVSRTRYRDGAMSWILSRDTEDPQRWLEVFVVESWAEHLRQHDRVTLGDKKIQEYAKGFHAGPGKPVVSHFIAAAVPRADGPEGPTALEGDESK